MCDDILADFRARLLERFSGREQTRVLVHVDDVERELRRDWGGQKVYVPLGAADAEAYRGVRDLRILAEHRRGDHVQAIARKWGVSERHVRRIVAAGQSAAPAPEVVASAPQLSSDP